MTLTRETVVVPIDFSESSVPAIETALAVCATREDVHVVHVLPADNWSAPVAGGDLADEAQRAEHLRVYMRTFLEGHGLGDVNQVILFGDPGTKIIEHAQACGADLIVIPSHGRHGIDRILLGSVAERVVRHADCQVLVLRRPDAD